MEDSVDLGKFESGKSIMKFMRSATGGVKLEWARKSALLVGAMPCRSLYDQLKDVGGQCQKIVADMIAGTHVPDSDVSEMKANVTTFAKTWLASHNVPIAEAIGPHAPMDTELSESDTVSDEEMEPAVVQQNPSRSVVRRKHDQLAGRHIVKSLRSVLKGVDARTHLGKSIQRCVALAACQPPRDGRLKAAMARILGIHHRIVTEGQDLYARFLDGSLKLQDLVKRTRNGRAIPEAIRNAVRAYYLDPANTRESPNASDQMLVLNPESGKKDLKVSRHWLEMPVRALHRQWLESVRFSCALLIHSRTGGVNKHRFRQQIAIAIIENNCLLLGSNSLLLRSTTYVVLNLRMCQFELTKRAVPHISKLQWTYHCTSTSHYCVYTLPLSCNKIWVYHVYAAAPSSRPANWTQIFYESETS